MFCPNCGQAAQGEFCTNCGARVSATGAAGAPAGVGSTGLTSNLASALCYVIPLIGGIIFLVMTPYNRDRQVRFHAFQSIFLAIAAMVVSAIISSLYPMMWSFAFMLHRLFDLAALILFLFLAFKAYQNEKVVLPVLGPLAEKQA